MALVGRWRDVLELEMSAGRGAGNGAVGNANMDSGGKGVAVINRGVMLK